MAPPPSDQTPSGKPSRLCRKLIALALPFLLLPVLLLLRGGSSRSDFRFSFRPSPREWQIGTGYLNFGPPSLRPRYFQAGPFLFFWGMRAMAEEFMKSPSTNAPAPPQK